LEQCFEALAVKWLSVLQGKHMKMREQKIGQWLPFMKLGAAVEVLVSVADRSPAGRAHASM
jgi:hypothetical protein